MVRTMCPANGGGAHQDNDVYRNMNKFMLGRRFFLD
jgi:hypothetical protein